MKEYRNLTSKFERTDLLRSETLRNSNAQVAEVPQKIKTEPPLIS